MAEGKSHDESTAAQVQESPRKWEMRRVWEGSAQLLDALDDGWEPFARHYVKDGRIHGHMIYLRRPMRDAAKVCRFCGKDGVGDKTKRCLVCGADNSDAAKSEGVRDE